jgi:hypothetical protein
MSSGLGRGHGLIVAAVNAGQVHELIVAAVNAGQVHELIAAAVSAGRGAIAPGGGAVTTLG